jgi:hypothetical protein
LFFTISTDRLSDFAKTDEEICCVEFLFLAVNGMLKHKESNKKVKVFFSCFILDFESCLKVRKYLILKEMSIFCKLYYEFKIEKPSYFGDSVLTLVLTQFEPLKTKGLGGEVTAGESFLSEVNENVPEIVLLVVFTEVIVSIPVLGI